MNSTNYFSLGSFILFSITGIAVGYAGSSCILFVSYWYIWFPNWMWFVAFALFITAIGILAVGVAGIIASASSNLHAVKVCSFLVLLVILHETVGTLIVYLRHATLESHLADFVSSEMVKSADTYGTNMSMTQFWDEVQLEKNCCGINNYTDWFSTTYGSGQNVPDSCCTIVTENCGRNVINDPEIEDDIMTEGCFPEIISTIGDMHTVIGTYICLPVFGLHVILFIILWLSTKYMKTSRRIFLINVIDVPVVVTKPRYHLLSNSFER